ncbi:MAG: tyrosine-protein phosphatase [Fimbriiglobus sp.]
MLPSADTHVHLLAGLDDGPETMDDALAMCRMLVREGTRHATALAHQSDSYPENTPQRLTEAAAKLVARLAEEKIGLTVYPTAEVMISLETADEWKTGKLLSYGGFGKFLLLEQPHGMFLDFRPVARALKPLGVRVVLAHAERYDEMMDDPGMIEECIALGCLVQVTTDGIVNPPSGRRAAVLKDWAKRGIIHLLGSDGHGPVRRAPKMAEGYKTLIRYAGPAAADRIAGIWGPALLQGRPVKVPPPVPRTRTWFSKLFGG